MSRTLPFGGLQKATILVIGHDPRLQGSMAEAEYAFFFDYLKKFDKCPTYGSEKNKYGLAKAVWDYINELADQHLALDAFYVTNLCNEFLPPSQGRGTVLIPDDLAQQGVEAICKIIEQGDFSIIVPMAMQTFYHLCHQEFLDENDKRVQMYIDKACPIPSKVEQGIYGATGKAPFLDVCGQRFHHDEIPLVPILHVKQWPIRTQSVRYTEPMQRAQKEISAILR